MSFNNNINSNSSRFHHHQTTSSPHSIFNANIAYGNRLFDLNSFFNERAGPRRSRPFGGGWRSSMLPSIISDNIQAPHYARVHNIYPEFQHLGSSTGGSGSLSHSPGSSQDDPYRYVPPSARGVANVGGPSTSLSSDQVTEIPVVHMVRTQQQTSSDLQSTNSVARRLGTSSSSSSIASSANRITAANGANSSSFNSLWSSPSSSSGEVSTSRLPSSSAYSSASASSTFSDTGPQHSKGGSEPHQRHSSSSSTVSTLSSSSTPTTTRADPTEAEVDALTTMLIRKLSAGTIEAQFANSNTAETSTRTGTPPSPGSPAGGSRDSPGTLRTTNQKRSTADPGDSCYRCLRPIDAQHPDTVKCMALRVLLHSHCFHCFKCDQALAPDDYYLANNRLLCVQCVRTSLEKCYACDEEIKERVIRGLGHPYHPRCFTCTVCGRCLDGNAFTFDIHKRIHCLEDFHKRYGPRCAACGLPITPVPGRQETKRVVTKNLSYHLECFNVNKHSP